MVTQSLQKNEIISQKTKVSNEAKQKKRRKRANSFEKTDRPTLLQELLTGVKEERNEDSD